MRKFLVEGDIVVAHPPPTAREIERIKRLRRVCTICGRPANPAIVVRRDGRYEVYCVKHSKVPRLYFKIFEKLRRGICDICGSNDLTKLNIVVMADGSVHMLCLDCIRYRAYGVSTN